MVLLTFHNYVGKSTDKLKSKMLCLRKHSSTFPLFFNHSFRFEKAFIELWTNSVLSEVLLSSLEQYLCYLCCFIGKLVDFFHGEMFRRNERREQKLQTFRRFDPAGMVYCIAQNDPIIQHTYGETQSTLLLLKCLISKIMAGYQTIQLTGYLN